MRRLSDSDAKVVAAAGAAVLAGREEDAELLDFTKPAQLSTPCSGDAGTRESWVEQMDAELAEFDALVGETTPSDVTAADAGWERGLERELAARISSAIATPSRT